MDNTVDVSFHYKETMTLKQTSRSFIDAVKFCFESPGIRSHDPIKVVFNSTKKVLYFDKNKFQAFANGEKDLEELVEETQCDGVFRNIVDIELRKDHIIEHASLWKKVDNNFILIDDDQHIAVECTGGNFIEV